MNRLFQIYDTVGKQPMGPILCVRHEAAAIRHFTDVLADKNTILGAHPQDFELLDLGNQDEDTGELDPCTPTPVLTGKQWLQIQESRQSPATEVADTAPQLRSRV